MPPTHRLAQLASNPTVARLGMFGLTLLLGVIWGSFTGSDIRST
jgi:hypothetical protein